MLYGSLYKVFKQLSKQQDKNGKNQYDELIIPNLFLKILLNDGKIPKMKKSIKKNNNKTANKDDIININNFISEEIDKTSTKINPYFNFKKMKQIIKTPTVKNSYINKPNISLPKIKFKKRISILTKKAEDLKNLDKHDFLLSGLILKQMKKTYYRTPSHISRKSYRIRNSMSNIKINTVKSNEINEHKRNNNTTKDENNKKKKVFNKILIEKKIEDKDNVKVKEEAKTHECFNKVNIISNNKNLMLSKKNNEISYIDKIENNLSKRNNMTNYGLLGKNNSLKNKSCSRLIKFIKDKQTFNNENGENVLDDNNSIKNNNFDKKRYSSNNNNIFNNHIRLKKEFFKSSNLFRKNPKINFKHKTLNIYSISISKKMKSKHNTLEEIDKILTNNIINFPLNSNICSGNEIFYYRVNRMYRNQFIQYMSHRINWEIIDNTNNMISSEQKIANFEWRYYSNKINYKNYKYDPSLPPKKLKMVNLFEKNYEIGNKKNMFINLINYCDKVNINVFDIVPFTLIISNSQYVEEALELVQSLMEFVEINKYHKGNLYSNKKYNELFWYDKNFESLTNQYVNINKTFISSKNYWIIKPTDLYQGKCIEISNSYEEIVKKCRNIFRGVDKWSNPTQININTIDDISSNDKLLTMDNAISNTLDKKNGSGGIKKKIINSRMYCSNEIIIQKYLDNPFLYKKRKFDIRCFVLVDCNMNVFFCKEGHLKGSSESYNLDNTNKFIHITNHSLQKKSNKFEMYELGNEMSYQDFKNYLISENISLEKFDEMINQMKLLVKISFKSVGNKLLKTTPPLCFEIFGYDFILDNEFKIWILEINNNPGLGISSPLIGNLVPRMLDDAFRLTIDKVFNTRYSNECFDENGKYKSKYKLDGFKDDEIIFEYLCNIN